MFDQSPFQSFAPDSRIWIFQSLHPLTADQQTSLTAHLNRFASQWKAHQAPLTSAFRIYFEHVIVVAVDAAGNGTTGCSIDSLHQAMSEISRSLQIDVFDRLHIPVLQDGALQFMTRKQLLEGLRTGLIHDGTLILDQTILDLDTWRQDWVKPVGKSWVMRGVPERV